MSTLAFPIVVAIVTPDIRAAVLALSVRPEQAAFVGPVQVSLLDAEQCAGSTPMAILRDGVPIGYYRIEHAASSVVDRDFEVPSIGLRSFFIDTAWQGRGLGQPVMTALIRDMATRHHEARQVVLTVNCRNTAALALYCRAGFVQHGGLYHGGRAGPQHVLVRPLP
ncbi:MULTISPECIES: GNAT family N-acetyltransferase [Dyella]|uniref:GNAT family N-acetyltransferase n=2 Tax=Dyella TaxID=231454 RepID=A0A4R0YQ31_9GAMM|nr:MULTISPECIES: GNAT family N-acetyltransferase [Dyella]TBR35781.1 GNAT family N-acetyltransferase [Dyella terrae]TCI08671.1 GNAT family N-acetyltransferase [Dyella soli]